MNYSKQTATDKVLDKVLDIDNTDTAFILRQIKVYNI